MPDFTHFDDKGAAHMVDVSAKAVTSRVAVARGFISMQPATLALGPRAVPKRVMCSGWRVWRAL